MPEAEKPKVPKVDKSDALYVAGALLIVIALALSGPVHALIAAGCFCLVFPVLELVSGFIRGVK